MHEPEQNLQTAEDLKEDGQVLTMCILGRFTVMCQG